ncbi:HK97-gp10 family putative phage morphogenesis protein [Halopseudomonas sp.]|uniref:HK97-gp10 family putative phage morphogenesis protein n=1 Tax=Halopseudomonas sp. TaxID=2901191 RepID=UPI0031205217
MSESVSVNVDGLAEVLGKFEAIETDLKLKGGRFALRKAAQLVRDRARQNAASLDDPETAANIERNIVERWSGRAFKQRGDLMFRVGVMGGAGGNASSASLDGLPGKDTRHWRYKEFGTETVPATPFLRRALADNISAAISEFATQYDKKMTRAIKAAKKKAGIK